MAGFTQPLVLLTISAVINAFAMLVHIALTLWLNLKKLEIPIRPSFVRVTMMAISFLFFSFFVVKTLLAY
jgi:hypothetical protein